VLIKVDNKERARRVKINMDVTRCGALPVLSDGPLAAQVVCPGTLENVDLRSEKVCAYMATPRSGGCEQHPRSHRDAAYFLHELALLQPRHRHHKLVKLLPTHASQCESAI